MEAKDFIDSYWNYYIELENKLIRSQHYVAFHKRNNATFSNEYIELLQVICSEIDVVGKIIARHFNPAFVADKYTHINKWGFEVQQYLPLIQSVEVVFRFGYELKPWEKWIYTKNMQNRIVLDQSKKAESPFWWIAYNKVKHERTSIGVGKLPNYMRANQKCVIYALAALYVLEKHMLEEFSVNEDIFYEPSHLFRIKMLNYYIKNNDK